MSDILINTPNSLMDLIFSNVKVQSRDIKAIEQVKKTLLEEAVAYRTTIEVLKSYELDTAEVADEVAMSSGFLDLIEKDIKENRDNDAVKYAVEVIQLNSINDII